MKNPCLERLNQEYRTAEIRLTREKHRGKQQLAEVKELTRKVDWLKKHKIAKCQPYA